VARKKLTLRNLRKSPSPTRVRSRNQNVLAPPDLVAPLNLSPIIVEEWKIQRSRRFDSNGSPFRMPCPYTLRNQHDFNVYKDREGSEG